MVNIGKMMKQAQEMQQKMEKIQQELAEKEVSHSAGGGMVTATANGRQELVDIKISPDVIDPDDPEMLEDMVIAAVNGALEASVEMAQEEMAKVAGIGGIPGLM